MGPWKKETTVPNMLKHKLEYINHLEGNISRKKNFGVAFEFTTLVDQTTHPLGILRFYLHSKLFSDNQL